MKSLSVSLLIETFQYLCSVQFYTKKFYKSVEWVAHENRKKSMLKLYLDEDCLLVKNHFIHIKSEVYDDL